MKRALCIGINDYPGTDSDLAGCVNDANDWAALLGKRGFSVDKLLNKKATRKGIREALTDLVKSTGASDSLIVQFSGHGSFVPDKDGDEADGTDECLCPYDVGTKGPVTDDDLFEIYTLRKPGSQIVMLSDSCHSGTVARFAPITTPPTMRGKHAPQRKVRFLPPQVFLSSRAVQTLGLRRTRRAASPPGRYAALLMSGCQDTEYSYDAFFQGRPNGAFTFVALRELKRLPQKASYRDWFNAIRKALPSAQYPQTPNLYGSTNMKRWKVFA